MQSTSNLNNLFSPENMKCVEVNGNSVNTIDTKIFINGIENVRNLLISLEKSIRKSDKYEDQLMRCKSNHYHIHDINEWWDYNFASEDYKCSKRNTPRSHLVLSESLSTMSIVYLQFQYEELWKQYETLFQTYKERCSAVNARNSNLTKLQERLKSTNAQVINAHQALLSIGDKYLTLRCKKNEQMRKCNQLYLENLRLKTRLKKLMINNVN